VAGAAWHEFYETGATLWTPDRENAEFEAERRYPTNEWIESPRLTAAEGRVAELESLLRECNAVCLCGCPDADHEADECGESCGHDEHECIRVAPAVLDYVNRLRSRPLPPGVEAAAEALRYELDEVVRDLTYATLNTRHVRTVLSYLSSARGAKGGAE
jgi:hypothetical protein